MVIDLIFSVPAHDSIGMRFYFQVEHQYSIDSTKVTGIDAESPVAST